MAIKGKLLYVSATKPIFEQLSFKNPRSGFQSKESNHNWMSMCDNVTFCDVFDLIFETFLVTPDAVSSIFNPT